MIFYILLTYGPKPCGAILTHPAAQAQLRYIRQKMAAYPGGKSKITYDYARHVDRLDSLPRLKSLLSGVHELDGIKVRIDDLSRIFRITNLTRRTELLVELQAFGTTLHSIKHGKSLAEFSDTELQNLVLHPEKSRFPAKQRRTADTSKARASSSRSRTDRSLRTGQQLSKIKNELTKIHGEVTLKMISEEANAQGVTTTRGQKWTSQNVARMLKTLEQGKEEK